MHKQLMKEHHGAYKTPCNIQGSIVRVFRHLAKFEIKDVSTKAFTARANFHDLYKLLYKALISKMAIC